MSASIAYTLALFSRSENISFFVFEYSVSGENIGMIKYILIFVTHLATSVLNSGRIKQSS